MPLIPVTRDTITWDQVEVYLRSIPRVDGGRLNLTKERASFPTPGDMVRGVARYAAEIRDRFTWGNWQEVGFDARYLSRDLVGFVDDARRVVDEAVEYTNSVT